jgi:hypothetical protein
MTEFDMYSGPAVSKYRMEVTQTSEGAIVVLLFEWRKGIAMPPHWAIVHVRRWVPQPGASFDTVWDLMDTAVWVLAHQ